MHKLLYDVIWLLSCLPLGFHYAVSDLIIYPVLYHIVRYRRKLVRKNLSLCFTEWDEQQLRKKEKEFYHFFADLLVEIPHFLHMSKKEGFRRIQLENWELVEKLTEQYGGCILMTSHYGNWEWLAFVQQFITVEKGQFYNIYRRLDSKAFDHYMYEQRIRHGAENVEKHNLLRQMVVARKEGIKGHYGMIADQSPSWHNIHYWTTFLGRPTAILTGSETLARKFKYPVFYAENKRTRRGYYHCKLYLLAEQSDQTPEFEITEKYARLLEKTIQEEPAYWLWTHNRWKHQPPTP